MNDILILGGTGKTGRRIAQRLRADGQSVRSASRTRGDVLFDLGEPSTWPAALHGVAAAYLVEPEVQGTDEGQQRIPRLVDAAAKAGVRRLVLLTAPGVEGNQAHPLWPAEEAVMNSGLEWTIVRPTWFAQNFSEAFWLPGILDGSLRLPVGDGVTAFIDADDIADVVGAALTGDGHHGQAYVLSGPRAISFAEAVALIGKASGRTVRHVDISPEECTQAQIAVGVPEGAARQLTRLYTDIRDGKAEALYDGVQRALDRQPRAFEDFVSAAAEAGAWDNADRLPS
jgi:uncharacterized protein YbjT (DUF2867 family)